MANPAAFSHQGYLAWVFNLFTIKWHGLVRWVSSCFSGFEHHSASEYTSEFMAQETTNIGNQTRLAGKSPLCVCDLPVETADFLASSVRLSTNSWEICPGTMVEWPGGSRKMPAKRWTVHELVHREIWIVPSYPSALLFSFLCYLFDHGPFCLSYSLNFFDVFSFLSLPSFFFFPLSLFVQ